MDERICATACDMCSTKRDPNGCIAETAIMVGGAALM